MKNHRALLTPLILVGALAASPSALAQAGCADIEFTDEILSAFPEAPEACTAIVDRDGKLYAQLVAEVQRVSGSQVRVRFLLPDNRYTESYTYDVSPDARVSIDGRDYRYRELDPGQELRVYLPPDRWEFYVPETESFAEAEAVAVVTPEPETEEPEYVAALPATASPLPLIGLFGGLFIALGTILFAIRRRFF